MRAVWVLDCPTRIEIRERQAKIRTVRAIFFDYLIFECAYSFRFCGGEAYALYASCRRKGGKYACNRKSGAVVAVDFDVFIGEVASVSGGGGFAVF